MRTNTLTKRCHNTPDVAQQIGVYFRCEEARGRFRHGAYQSLGKENGICKICGMYLEIVTHNHANMHNYVDRQAFKDSGNIRWL
jgi:hypothetical protein